jgi:hypothetical protein
LPAGHRLLATWSRPPHAYEPGPRGAWLLCRVASTVPRRRAPRHGRWGGSAPAPTSRLPPMKGAFLLPMFRVSHRRLRTGVFQRPPLSASPELTVGHRSRVTVPGFEARSMSPAVGPPCRAGALGPGWPNGSGGGAGQGTRQLGHRLERIDRDRGERRAGTHRASHMSSPRSRTMPEAMLGEVVPGVIT